MIDVTEINYIHKLGYAKMTPTKMWNCMILLISKESYYYMLWKLPICIYESRDIRSSKWAKSQLGCHMIWSCINNIITNMSSYKICHYYHILINLSKCVKNLKCKNMIAIYKSYTNHYHSYWNSSIVFFKTWSLTKYKLVVSVNMTE